MTCHRCPFVLPCWGRYGDFCECPHCFRTLLFVSDPAARAPGGLALIRYVYIFKCSTEAHPIDYGNEVSAQSCVRCVSPHVAPFWREYRHDHHEGETTVWKNLRWFTRVDDWDLANNKR